MPRQQIQKTSHSLEAKPTKRRFRAAAHKPDSWNTSFLSKPTADPDRAAAERMRDKTNDWRCSECDQRNQPSSFCSTCGYPNPRPANRHVQIKHDGTTFDGTSKAVSAKAKAVNDAKSEASKKARKAAAKKAAKKATDAKAEAEHRQRTGSASEKRKVEASGSRSMSRRNRDEEVAHTTNVTSARVAERANSTKHASIKRQSTGFNQLSYGDSIRHRKKDVHQESKASMARLSRLAVPRSSRKDDKKPQINAGSKKTINAASVSSFVSRMTDSSNYTGIHKARFDEDGQGRGIAGRDLAGKGRDLAGRGRGEGDLAGLISRR